MRFQRDDRAGRQSLSPRPLSSPTQRPLRAAIGRSGVLGHPDPRLTLLDNLQQYIGVLHGQLHRCLGHLLSDHCRRWRAGSGRITLADARKASSSARIPPGRHVPVNSTRRLRNSPDRCSPVASVLKWERRCREPDGPGTHTFAAPAAPGMSMTDKSTSWNKLLRSPRARIPPHEHHAGDDAVLFRVTDVPLLDALGFLRST